MSFNIVREDFNVDEFDASLMDMCKPDDLRALVSIDIGGEFYRFVVDSRDLVSNGRNYLANLFLSFPQGLTRTAGGQADSISMVFNIGDVMTASGHTGIMTDLTQVNLRGSPVQFLLAFIEGGQATSARLKFAGRIERAPLNYQSRTMRIDVLSYVRIARDNIAILSLPVSHRDRFGVDDKSLDAGAGISSTTIVWNGDAGQ